MNKQQINELLNSLTLDQKIGQLLQCPGSCFGQDGTATGLTNMSWINEELIDNCGSILNVYSNKRLRDIQKNHLEKNPVPLMIMADIINGYRLIFPVSIAQGCSFNPELAKKAAEITAFESAKNGINVTFSPMVDVSRDPRWGRVSEGYGEATILNCDFAKANVEGYQGDGIDKDNTIAACVKHFAAYGATSDGRDYYGVEMSERMLRTTYLPPYRAAVDAGAEMLMPAFNTINGVPCTSNKFLLNDVLRGEWGFKGVVISDYSAINGICVEGAVNSEEECAKISLECGVDIDMVDAIYPVYLKKAIEKGIVSEELVDKSVLKILEFKNKLGLLDDPYKYIKEDSEKIDLKSEQHKEFAIDMVCQSSVLLKNENILPLDSNKSTAFIGPFSNVNELMARWSTIIPYRDNGISIEQALDEKFGEKKFKCVSGSTFACAELRFDEDMENDAVGREEEALLEAIELAKSVENVVLVLGEHKKLSGESKSRSDISLPEPQKRLFDEVYKVNKNIVVVMFAGRPLDIKDISEKAKSVLYMWHPGTYGAQAIVDMLFGDRIPSGKLSMTIPQNIGQIPIHHEKLSTNHYVEMGGRDAHYCCRYIDVTNLPLYPFGFGLSYTTFDYSTPYLNKSTMTRDEKLRVSVDITNTGDYDAYEAVQLYIHDVKASNISLPLKSLKAYKKVFIKKGETKTIDFEINEEMLKYYDYNMNYISENGEFEVFVGKDSMTDNCVKFELV